jgi:large subunit ribosomal protein L32
MACCAFVAAILGLVITIVVGRRGDGTATVRVASPSYTPAVLEPMLVTGYPEEQLPTPDTSRVSTRIEESSIMAVPKRRMSRANTRSRRAQWKAKRPELVGVTVAGQQHKVPRRLLKAARLGLIDLDRR